MRSPDPEAALVARSVVWRALATLDPRRRAVLVMHELEGSPVEVIATHAGCDLGDGALAPVEGTAAVGRGDTGRRGDAMKELRDWLKEADPVANEPPLSDGGRAANAAAIVAATDESRQWSFADWARGSWAAATVVVALTIAVGMSRWMHAGRGTDARHRRGVRRATAFRRPPRADRCS